MNSILKILKVLFFSILVNFSIAQNFLNGSFENNTAGAVNQINLTNAAFNGFMANTNAFGTTGNMDIIKTNTWGGGFAQHCTWYVALTGSGTDAFAMTLSAPLVTGTTYTISFWDRKDAGFGAFPIQIGLSTVNNAFGTIIYTAPVAPTNNVWTQRTFTFVAPNNGQFITVQMNGGNTGNWAHVDNFVMNNASSSSGGLNIAASATTICIGSSATFTASGATSYTWTPAATLSSSSASIVTANPTVSTIYSVTGSSGGCVLTGSISLNVTNAPTISVSPTLTSLCSGSSVTLTSNGSTTYTWGPSSGLSSTSGSVVIATPTANTTYTVKGGAGTCTAQAITTVSVTNVPTVSISGYFTVCNGSSTTLTASGATTYTWNTGAANNSIIVSPSVTTIYTVTGFNGICNSNKTVTVTVLPNPTITVSPTLSAICAGSSVTLTANGSTSYTWSPTVSLNVSTGSLVIASPTINTTYTVVGGVGSCTNNALATVTIAPNPSINVISSPSVICNGSSSTLTVNGLVNYTWSPSGSLSSSTGSMVTASPTVNTTYTVIGAIGTCTASTAISLSVNTVPTVAIAGTFSLCTGGSTSFTASGAPSYSWNTGATSASLNVSPVVNTTYTVTGINSNCSSTQTVLINVIPVPTIAITGNNTICNGQGTTLMANGAASYLWNTGANTSTLAVSPLTSTSYTVIGANSSCTSTAVQLITVLSNPTISASSTGSICSGQSAQLTANGANSYTWSTGQSAQTISVSPGVSYTYAVIGTAVNGCTSTAITSVFVQPNPFVGLSAIQPSICYGTQTQLTATGANNFLWSPSVGLNTTIGATVNASPNSNQIYTVTGINGAGTATCSSSNTIALFVIPNATINITGKDSICSGQRTFLNAYGAVNYTWFPPSNLNNAYSSNVAASPTITTTYTLMGSSSSGMCPGYKTITIYVNPVPSAYAGRDTTILYGDYTYLSGSGNGNVFTWTGGDNSSINCINCPTTYINPVQNTCYLLEVVNSHGCKNTDEVCINVDKDFALYIPNSFTPNDDGLNDVFMPKGYGVIEYELYVFNRWGQKLYYGKGNLTKNEIVGWDGTYKGETCKEDVYVYKIIYTNTSRKSITKSGNVNLLRRNID